MRPAWEIDLFLKALPPLEGDERPVRRGPSRAPADLKDLPIIDG